VAATYNLATDLGKVRLEIPDTDVKKPIFEDEEIQYFLDVNKGDIYLATAHALSIIMGDPNRSIQWSRGSVSATKNMQEALQSRIKQLQEKAGGQVFESVPVERHDWYE